MSSNSSKRIPFRSKKNEAKYVERRVLVERLLKERPICESCGTRASVDIHELVSRARGGSILDEVNLLAVCRPCHTWITQRPKAAEFLGLALPSWTTPEMYVEAAERREIAAAGGHLDAPSWL